MPRGEGARDRSGSLMARAARRSRVANAVRLLPVVALFLAAANPAQAAAGAGYGESMRLYGGAPEAGSGGLPLESFTNPDSEIYTNQSYMTAGVRWIGLGLEVGLFSALRVGVEGVMVTAGGAEGSGEGADGTYSGSLGKLSADETAIRGNLQWNFGAPKFTAAVRVEMQSLSQDISGNRGEGLGTKGHVFGMYRPGESWNLMAWGSGGPFGSARGFDFASAMSGGAGLDHPGGLGLLGGSEGLRFGAEYGMSPGGDKPAIGSGLVYWFGGSELDGSGLRLVLRGGFRGEPNTVAPSQGRFGVGVTFRDDQGVGWGADYGFVPFGDLGVIHYLSARIKLGLGLFRHVDDSSGERGGTTR